MAEVVEETSGVTKSLVLDNSLVKTESDGVAVDLDHESEDVEEREGFLWNLQRKSRRVLMKVIHHLSHFPKESTEEDVYTSSYIGIPIGI